MIHQCWRRLALGRTWLTTCSCMRFLPEKVYGQPFASSGHEHLGLRRWSDHSCVCGLLVLERSRAHILASSWQSVCSQQGEDESVTLKSCTRRKTDSIEKRFCFDVEAVDRWVTHFSQEQILVNLRFFSFPFSQSLWFPPPLSLLHPSANIQLGRDLRPVADLWGCLASPSFRFSTEVDWFYFVWGLLLSGMCFVSQEVFYIFKENWLVSMTVSAISDIFFTLKNV